VSKLAAWFRCLHADCWLRRCEYGAEFARCSELAIESLLTKERKITRFNLASGNTSIRGGRVYKAFNRTTKNEAAIKIVSQSSLIDKESIRNFNNEVSVLKLLNHDNIIKLFDVYEDKFNYYLAMEVVAGGELFERIASKVFYNESEARELCRCILGAIHHCHRQNIAHRDIKPENLLMASKTDDFTVKLCDFGFSEIVNGDSLSGYMGSPIYMAPEVITHNTKYGKAIDMWSFGVMVFIILGGYPPFYDEDVFLLEEKIQTATYEFHDEYWSSVSEDAKDFIRKCLVVDAKARMTADEATNHSWVKLFTI
jgi:serine/threonine protein kinase